MGTTLQPLALGCLNNMNVGKIFKFVKIHFCRRENKNDNQKNLASHFMARNDKPLQLNM
jgi:hypothetical protein